MWVFSRYRKSRVPRFLLKCAAGSCLHPKSVNIARIWLYYEIGDTTPQSLSVLQSERPQLSRALFPPLGRNLRVLLVWPRFPPSFGGMEGVLEMLHQGAISPPLGLITVAALCPPGWTLRLLDRAFD